MYTRQLGKSQETAAAKAAISERSGRRIENGEWPSIPGGRHWRSREDPFEAIWEKELVLLLEKEARLTLWEYLEDEHAGKLPFSVLRTPLEHLQQRAKNLHLCRYASCTPSMKVFPMPMNYPDCDYLSLRFPDRDKCPPVLIWSLTQSD